MLLNTQIKLIIKRKKHIVPFSKFLKITPCTLYSKLNNDEKKESLFGAYVDFLLSNDDKYKSPRKVK